MFGAIKSVGKLNAAGYVLFGHSAGAQFVHRLLAFSSRASANGTEQGHLLRAVAANAGSYTLPTFEERFPFGFGGLEALFSQEDLSAFVSAPLTVLLGQEDTDPNHKHLPTDEAAQRQGTHRLARGHFFFNAALDPARTLETSCGWSLQTVPGVGHAGTRMLRRCLAAGQLFPAHDRAKL